MKTLTEILQYIEEEADERELKLIVAAYGTGVRRARAIKARQLRSELKKGDKVEFVAIKPKYLTGVEATVLEVLGDKLRLDMGRPIRRYGRVVTTPITTVRKVG